MLVIHPPQDTLEKAAGLRRLRPALQDSPFSYVLVLTGLTLHKDCREMRSANAIQENGVPRDQNENASRMLALRIKDATLPKSYDTVGVIDCQGENLESGTWLCGEQER
jgi:hypothetical protein